MYDVLCRVTKIKFYPSLIYSNKFGFFDNFINYLILSSFFIQTLRFTSIKFLLIKIKIKSKTKNGDYFFRDFLSPLPKEFSWEVYLSNLKKINFKKNINILDIGAHLGYFSCFGAINNSEINYYGIEPDPDNFICLTKTVNKNNINNIKLYNFLLSDSNDEQDFYQSNSSTMGFISRATPSFGYKKFQPIKINSFSIESFLRLNQLLEIELLKCDIEGAEYLVFEKNLTILLKSKYIIFELHKVNNILPENTKLFKFIKENFEIKIVYPSLKSYGKDLVELFGIRKP